jgi:putative SOS response-associated peptidase YedK
MCGRYTLTRPAKVVADAFGAFDAPETEPRYNVAPTQPALAVRQSGERRECVLLRWGFVAPWSAGKSGPPLINAMAETAASKPVFRESFATRRCLVPADGFYEWLAEGKKRQPYLFSLRDGGLFAFAGLWQVQQNQGEWSGAVCILTTEANELVQPVHGRMPAILPPDAYDSWLDPATADAERLAELLRPYPASEMASRAVSAAVNSARNEGPRCVEAAEPEQPSLF